MPMTMTAGEARQILEAAQGGNLTARSEINPQFTKAMTWDILWDGVDGLADDAPIDKFTARNIRREFEA